MLASWSYRAVETLESGALLAAAAYDLKGADGIPLNI